MKKLRRGNKHEHRSSAKRPQGRAAASSRTSRRLLWRRMAQAEIRPVRQLDQSGHRRLAWFVRGLRRRRYRRRGRCGQESLRQLAQHAALRACPPAQARGQRAARARRRTGDDRRRRLRQSGPRNGHGRDHRGGANRFLRRPGDGSERRLDPDGTGRRQFHGAPTARRGRAHHSVQSSVHVLRRKIGARLQPATRS